MPEEIIVASWRVMTVSSAAFTRLTSVSSMLRPDFFSASWMTLSPCLRSWSMTSCLEDPEICPFDGTPAPSTALYVQTATLMSRRHRDRHHALGEAAHLGRLRRARL